MRSYPLSNAHSEQFRWLFQTVLVKYPGIALRPPNGLGLSLLSEQLGHDYHWDLVAKEDGHHVRHNGAA